MVVAAAGAFALPCASCAFGPVYTQGRVAARNGCKTGGECFKRMCRHALFNGVQGASCPACARGRCIKKKQPDKRVCWACETPRRKAAQHLANEKYQQKKRRMAAGLTLSKVADPAEQDENYDENDGDDDGTKEESLRKAGAPPPPPPPENQQQISSRTPKYMLPDMATPSSVPATVLAAVPPPLLTAPPLVAALSQAAPLPTRDAIASPKKHSALDFLAGIASGLFSSERQQRTGIDGI